MLTGGSFDRTLGDKREDPAALDLLSLEKHVPADFPPTFLWTTFEDDAVPMQNTLLMAWALREQNIPYELHIFPEGQHGISLATEETSGGEARYVKPRVAQWLGLCQNWLQDRFAELAAQKISYYFVHPAQKSACFFDDLTLLFFKATICTISKSPVFKSSA